MFRMKLAFTAGAMLCLALPAAQPAPPIATDQFRPLLAVIKPDKNEDKWSEIPWQASLWEARKQAAAQGKPILLWEMDGHPLGCT